MIVQQQIIVETHQLPIQSITILSETKIAIFSPKQYSIFNIITSVVQSTQSLSIQISSSAFNHQLEIILLLTKGNPKNFIKLNPYDGNLTTLYNFSQQPSKYNMELEPSILVQQYSGNFCLLRKFHNETFVVCFNNKLQRYSQFYINEDCLSNYDNTSILVNYRQIMLKRQLQIMLVHLSQIVQQNNIENVHLDFQEDQKGIVNYISQNKQANIIIAINLQSFNSLFVIANRKLQTIIHKVKRNQLFLSIFNANKAENIISYQYWVNFESQTQTRYSLINPLTGIIQGFIKYQDSGQNRVISVNHGIWVEYSSNWKLKNNQRCRVYKIFKKNILLMHLCQSVLQKSYKSQFIHSVYNLLV